MKRFFKKILSVLNINGRRDLPAFLVCLLLAFSIWLIYSLSISKSREPVKVPVVAKCKIEGHSIISSNVCDVEAKCQITGFKFLSNKYLKKPTTVEFSSLTPAGGVAFYLTSAELMEYADKIFGSKITVEHFLSDTFFFSFPYETSKRVPIRANHEFDFKPQHTAVGKVVLVPDSVTVYGEPYELDKVNYVSTALIKQSRIDSDLHGTVKLAEIRGLRFSEGAVEYSVDVDRYVEITKTVAVKVRNVPADKRLTPYPSSVNAKFRCRFPFKVGQPYDSVEFYVDYNDFVASHGGKCLVNSDHMPFDVINFTLDPEVVECMESDRQL